MYLPDINALRGITSLPTPMEEFLVSGHFTSGDGGGGIFTWVDITVSPPMMPDDGGIVIVSPALASLGYFKRIYSGPINVRWFGAILGETDPNPPIDPFTGLPLVQPIADVTVYVHRARDSKAFADNGTLYFPNGVYPGAFEFTCIWGSPNYLRNEINLIGDGEGSILTSNGATGYMIVFPDGSPDPTPYNYPILRLGYRRDHWRWAKVNNLKIDGSFGSDPKFAWGVTFESQGTPHGEGVAGRWIFEQVFFINCDKAVFKFAGNIGNHFIDCTWTNNSYGVYANALIGVMHNGCDRFTGGHFAGHTEAALRYALDSIQIILDGTIIENNPGWAVRISNTQPTSMTWNEICLRNVYFERNGDDNSGGDLLFENLRSVRIDGSKLHRIWLRESSVNLYNCRYDADAGGIGGNGLLVDEKSSIVAYEHRYNSYPTSKIFVNSISYDGSWDVAQQRWHPTSVWGPLRVVTTTKENIEVSEQFDTSGETWDIYGTTTFWSNSYVHPSRVLGNGSNRLYMGPNNHIWSKNIIGNLTPGYYVWSIHAYLEEASIAPEGEFYGEIVDPGGNFRLGYVYFTKGQWACSYGMKYIDRNIQMRLAFKTINAPMVHFCITDYQIIRFDDLASANAFVNSREFAIRQEE